MRNVSPITLIISLFTILAFPGLANAVSFASSLPVLRFEVAGGASFVDEFDDGAWPASTWNLVCGAASEGGGALSVAGTGPGCGVDLFLAAPFLFFTTDTTVTAEFGVPLPAEGEFIGLQLSTLVGDDRVSLTLAQVGGTVFASAADEGGVQASIEILPEDLPSGFYTLQIAVATDGAGALLPTFGGSVDGDPLFTVPLPDLALELASLPIGQGFTAAIIAGTVPEPSTGVLLLLCTSSLGLCSGRRSV